MQHYPTRQLSEFYEIYRQSSVKLESETLLHILFLWKITSHFNFTHLTHAEFKTRVFPLTQKLGKYLDVHQGAASFIWLVFTSPIQS